MFREPERNKESYIVLTYVYTYIFTVFDENKSFVQFGRLKL